MLEALNRTVTVGLSETGLAVVLGQGLLRQRREVLQDKAFALGVVPSAEALGLQLSESLAGVNTKTRGGRLHVVLSDDLVRLFMVTPPGNLTRLDDCKAAAAMRFQVLYDASPQGWHLQSDINPQRAFLCVAVSDTLRRTIMQVAEAQGLVLVQLAPVFVAAFNRWRHKLPAHAWFCVLHGNTLTLAVVSNRRITAVRSLSDDDALAHPQWLRQAVRREALQSDLPLPECIYLCSDVPGPSRAAAPEPEHPRVVVLQAERPKSLTHPAAASGLAEVLGWP